MKLGPGYTSEDALDDDGLMELLERHGKTRLPIGKGLRGEVLVSDPTGEDRILTFRFATATSKKPLQPSEIPGHTHFGHAEVVVNDDALPAPLRKIGSNHLR